MFIGSASIFRCTPRPILQARPLPLPLRQVPVCHHTLFGNGTCPGVGVPPPDTDAKDLKVQCFQVFDCLSASLQNKRQTDQKQPKTATTLSAPPPPPPTTKNQKPPTLTSEPKSPVML